jgi:hypothetical protein
MTYWERGGISPWILSLGTIWIWVVSFTPRPLCPRGRNTGIHWIGGWMSPRVGSDTVATLKSLSLWRKSDPNPPYHSLITIVTELPRPWECVLKLFLCFNWAPRYEGVLVSGCIAPLILWPRHWMEVSGQLHAPATLPPGKEPVVPIEEETGWAPEMFWTRWREKFPASAGNRTLELRSSSP